MGASADGGRALAAGASGIPCRRGGMRHRGRDKGTLLFLGCHTAALFCRGCDDQELNSTSSFGSFFGEGAMRRTRGCLGNTPIFLAIRKRCPRHRWLLEEGGSAGESSVLRRLSPFVWRHSLPLPYCLRATQPGAVVTTSLGGSPTPPWRASARR